MKRALAVLVLLVSPCGLANADPSEKLMADAFRAGDKGAAIYLNALAAGIEWANGMLADRGDRRLYCQPEKLGLTFDQRMDILNRFVAAHPRVAELPAGIVFGMALVNTFPCQSIH
jgi:hypothetical protein